MHYRRISATGHLHTKPFMLHSLSALLQCDCKKEHKSVYYVVKYRKSKCH